MFSVSKSGKDLQLSYSPNIPYVVGRPDTHKPIKYLISFNKVVKTIDGYILDNQDLKVNQYADMVTLQLANKEKLVISATDIHDNVLIRRWLTEYFGKDVSYTIQLT